MINDYHLIEQFIQQEIQEEKLLGASILLHVNGKTVYSNTFGTYKDDTIYRIYSMSKIITSIAILKLWEDKMLDLNDPVHKFFPEFKNLKISTSDKNLTDAQNTMTIQHLLNMTSGLAYPNKNGTCYELAWYEFEQRISELLKSGKTLTTSDICAMIADIPCAFEPGTSWNYSASADLLGGVIEKASGIPLDQYLKNTIFEPLEMNDTDFYIPDHKKHRIAPMYTRNSKTNKVKLLETTLKDTSDTDTFTLPDVSIIRTVKPAFLSGGAGLYCTIQDYQKIVNMLLNNGTYLDRQILNKETVDFLHSNQQTDELQRVMAPSGFAGELIRGYNYTNLVRIMKNPSEAAMSGYVGNIGEYGWDGLPGNYCLIDPQENMTLVFMIQVAEGANIEERAMLRKIIYS